MDKIGLNIVKNNVRKLKEAMHMLTMKNVMVGIPSSENSRDQSGEINNAALGYLHENGSPEQNIPARPFLIPGIRDCQSKVAQQFKTTAQRSIKGDHQAVEQGLHRVGLTAQNSVRATINAGIPPALAPITIAARRRKGLKGTKPLIRTGQLRNSIAYVIREK